MDLFGLAGQGKAGAGYNIGTGIGNTLSAVGPMAMMANPLVGGLMAGGGLLANLITGPLKADAQRREGEKMYGAARDAYRQKIADNPNYYTTQSVDSAFNRARSDMMKTNREMNNQMLDRFSSVQRRQLQNRIRSGLTAGAAQASALQNSMGFQRQAQGAAQQQSQALSNLDIRGAQARNAMYDQIQGRKGLLARDTLQAQGVTNPAALGGLTSRLKGY